MSARPVELHRDPPAPPPAVGDVRLHLHLQGAVQGVGFRPWCVQTARALGLIGWVRNDVSGLQCEIQGAPAQVEAFVDRLRTAPPPLARVQHWQQQALAPLATAGQGGFDILASAAQGELHTDLPADTAPCAACLDELFDPADRRWRHPFINCTHCGPRFTLTEQLPYDRAHTSMAGFALCPECAAEYRNPLDRRYHAQPIACPRCGPRLALWQADGSPIVVADPLAGAAARLHAGQVVAVKGVGGYHLMCDARQAAPLQRLRAAKQRSRKPFALLVPNLASARQWVELGPGSGMEGAAALLHSPARPIVLLPCRAGVAEAHPLIAPDLAEWGLMLPSTPLHWLLLHELLGRPADHAWREAAQPLLLVMTSANPGGEPLVTTESDAVARLPGLADVLLVHDRAIVNRVDDSVRRPLVQQGSFAPFVRRARGHVPDPIELPGVPADAPPVLATGGWLKNTLCLTRGSQAFLSPHLGDLGHATSRQALVEAVERLRRFLGVRPVAVAHDLHPDFYSSQHAQALAAQWQVPALAVQHHHAHAAAVLAEHGALQQPALALILDGTGLGLDGQAWGGELLRVQGGEMQRLGHLPRLALPGGDRAASEPWRMGAALLHALGRGEQIARRYATQPGAAQLATLLARGLNCPPSSSAGRLFDAAASLLGVVQLNGHEADAAMTLEARAARCPVAEPWPHAWQIDRSGTLRLDGLWQQLADADPQASLAAQCEAAARFHASLAAALGAWVVHHARAQQLRVVALGGGCLLNRLLRQGLFGALQAAGLRVLEAEQAPPNDGGLSLGQAAVALQRLLDGSVPDSSHPLTS